MTDVGIALSESLALLFFIFVTLLTFGANFAPDWAKSRGFLVAVCALVIVGSSTLH